LARAADKAKLARWFWCGVFGELYGGAVETRIALDVQQLLAWIDGASAQEPATVQAAGFNPNRLDTLRSRTSALYRGLYVLLQREGACDFFWKTRMVDLDRDDVKLDIRASPDEIERYLRTGETDPYQAARTRAWTCRRRRSAYRAAGLRSVVLPPARRPSVERRSLTLPARPVHGTEFAAVACWGFVLRAPCAEAQTVAGAK
jgi:hypothetical protein